LPTPISLISAPSRVRNNALAEPVVIVVIAMGLCQGDPRSENTDGQSGNDRFFRHVELLSRC
jgi:hypothetical protein